MTDEQFAGELGEVRSTDRSIHDEIRGLEELCTDERIREAGGFPPELSACLQALRERLKSVFAFEEEGGLFDDLVASLPADSTKIDKLRRDHGELASRLDGLIARDVRKGIEEFARLRVDVKRFLYALSEHEGAEGGLLQKSSSPPEGTVD